MNNPCVDHTKVHRPAPPSASEIRALLADTSKTATDRNLHDALLIIASTGLRPRELAQMKWADIDFGRRCLRVGTKTSTGTRLVPFGPSVLKRLTEHHEQSPGAECVFGTQPENSLRRVSSQLRNVSESQFERRINLHSLRHFFFARWMALGGQPELLARVAGCSLARLHSFRAFGCRYESGLAAVIQEQIEKSITA